MRRPLTVRRLVAAAAVSTLLLGLAACGSDDPKAATDPAANSSSPADSSEEPSDEASTDPSESAEGDGSEPAAGEKVDPADFIALMKSSVENATTAKMSMTMSAAGSDITAQGILDYATEPPAMQMKMTMPSLGNSPIDMRLLDGTMYMNMGEITQGKFIAFDLNDPNGPLGDMSALTDSMNPVDSLADLEGGLKSVVYVGDEDVDGEQLSHYELTVDTSKVKTMADQAATLPKTITYDIWFDSEDRTRQMIMDVPQAKTSIEVKMFDWDVPVTIKKPAPKQITSFPGT
jgi:LppX_LprAFG lipoprotein